MTRSPRAGVIDTLAELAGKVRESIYHVRKAPIDWMSWPFDTFPAAISVTCDEWNPLGDPSVMGGAQTAMFSIEIMRRRKSAEDVPEADVDQGLGDEIEADIQEICGGLMEATLQDDGGDAVILRLERRTARAVEVFDPTLNVQGAIVTLRIDF